MNAKEQTQTKIGNIMRLNADQINFFNASELTPDQRSVENSSNIAPRGYTSTWNAENKYNPKRYRFKAIVYYKNNPNKAQWLKSFDYNKLDKCIDEINGYMKLKRYIKHKIKGKYKTASIYMSVNPNPSDLTRDHDYLVDFYMLDQHYLQWKGKNLVRFGFIPNGKNNFVNLESKDLKFELSRWKREK
jgi:hypothetical protein